jgi:hypothetical protein
MKNESARRCAFDDRFAQGTLFECQRHSWRFLGIQTSAGLLESGEMGLPFSLKRHIDHNMRSHFHPCQSAPMALRMRDAVAESDEKGIRPDQKAER